MKNILLFFIFLIPAFLFAQYPSTGNKQRLGYQTTGDGLIWRGVSGDTVNKPNNRNYPYFQLDTVNGVLYRYIQTRGQWQPTSLDADSLVYATRYWVNSNFFPLQGGTLTGTGGDGFVGFPSQVIAPGTPASGLNVYAQGSSFNWKGTDGFERQFASTLTGGRTYTLPDVSGTFALGTGTTDRSARWSSTNTLAAGNFTDNGTKLQALLPFQLHQWTTAGRPTGVNGYMGYNTTFNWLDIYSSTGWFSPLQSSLAGGLGTATRVLISDANGRATDNSNFRFDGRVRAPYGYFSTSYGFVGQANKYIEGNPDGLRFNTDASGSFIFNASNGTVRPNSTNISLGVFNNWWSTFYVGQSLARVASGSATSPHYSFQDGSGNIVAAGMYATGTQANNNLGLSTKATAEAGATSKLFIQADGKIAIGTGFTSPSYITQWSSTDAISLPRGTVAQRPTIVSSTTPLRFNTDSTALEYGESVGTWRLLATRAYARSLVSSGADGNGIYTGSGTLASHTTRALIPETGNLFFSQKFNSNADSAYFNIVNYGDGERGVNFGVTDTSSTGYSRGYFESDGAGSMNWGFETNDVNGSTTVRALDGELDFITTAGNISLSAPVDQEITVQGLVRAKQEAYYEINSTSSPQNLSNTYSDNFINQGGTQATFTLVFPASPEDGQILKITYNNNISTLTLDGNGNTIVGTTVTTAVEGSQRVFKFYAGEGVWIRQN